MSQPLVTFEDLGRRKYQEVWDYQEGLVKANTDLKLELRKNPDLKARPENRLIFVEHPHVYTLGKSGSLEHLLLSEGEMAEKGVEFFKINRGGDITYHGPGQLVGYPIFDLEQFKPDLHWYLRNLEEAVILTLRDYGIEAGRIEGLTGVWLDKEGADPRKILAIGVRCSRWVTMHGFAFNVNSDLSMFTHIVPCGIDDKGVTSLQAELGHEVDVEEVKIRLKLHLQNLYGFAWAGQ